MKKLYTSSQFSPKRLDHLSAHPPFEPPPYAPPSKVSHKGIDAYDGQPLTLFDLSSHKRARDAIEFGLQMRHKDFHVFVVGEDRSGRMTGTLTYLKQHIKNFNSPPDWVYLNNFEYEHRPIPFSLPAGLGKELVEKLGEHVSDAATVLRKTFNNPHYLRQVDSLTNTFQAQMDEQISDMQVYARKKNFEIVQTQEGFNIEIPDDVDPAQIDQTALGQIRDKLNRLSLNLQLSSQKVQRKVHELKKQTAKKALQTLFDKFCTEYQEHLGDWIDDLKKDLLDHIDDFIEYEDESNPLPPSMEERYSVNLLIDHSDSKHPRVYVESNPTYENIFGSIKYRNAQNGGVETNFTLIRPGALHLANGGILVLRADYLAKNPDLWDQLKAALRDRKIRIEERHRDNTLPLLDAPEPKAIPLDVQVFLIASPYWYYTFFFNDPDFRSYFKIKADIDGDLPITPENLHVYRHLIHQNAVNLTGLDIDSEAIDYLTRYSSRWVGDMNRLSARFEQVADILIEAATLSDGQKIKSENIKHAIQFRRMRNSRLEDRHHEDITTHQLVINVEGARIGQINGLTYMSTGDHSYGMPARISARTYVGEEGIVNIERLTEMSGPIQQKSALILAGFLNGLFAQHFPISCSSSVTFEQSYVDVEGDSASMAELIAILSSLSGIPIRQDIAITGSMDQFGRSQAIGGTHYKIEGFFRVCQERGLTGKQGIIIPKANEKHLTLKDEVIDAIHDKKFFIWTVDGVFEAAEIMMDRACGIQHQNGDVIDKNYPYYKFTKNSIFECVFKQLKAYHAALRPVDLPKK